VTVVTEADLREDVYKLFLPPTEKAAQDSRSVGAELEMIPVYRSTGERVLAQSGHPSGSEFIASLAAEFGWREEETPPDASCWSFPDGRISFEPGGQIEFSSTVFEGASDLLASMEKWTRILSQRADRAGLELKTVGIEERAPLEAVPLQLHRRRYTEMTRYFDSISEFGVVMMRQTASLQINVDRGASPLDRWRLLNRLAPYMVAIFANSPRYAGADTGHKSYRAHVWRMLDPRRTGIVFDERDPAEAYLDFALDAPVILSENNGGYPTFRELVAANSATKELWDVHLTTLFPEIRPRDYFEIRSIDAFDPSHLCAALAFVCGIVYANEASADALALLARPDDSLLRRAGQLGLRDASLRKVAESLVSIAVDGCKRLGAAYISASDLQRAEKFFDRFTLTGRSPADGRRLNDLRLR
jgi:glutamate--cysteine ligase